MTGLAAFERRDFPRTASAIAFVMGLTVAITSAVAQDSVSAPPIPEAPGPGSSIYNYGTVDRTCLSWWDGCRTCSADTALSAAVCSNVGIACQPREVTCMTRRPDAEKK